MFTISQLQQFSGVKAHTIRIWEQRYNALQPNRSEGNTRYYDSNQLRRLLNIVSLMDTNYKVSELCTMDDKKLFAILEEQHKTYLSKFDAYDYFVHQLIAAGMSFDEAHFEKVFSNCLLRYGMNKTYINIIYPMLKRIGLMWLTDSISPNYEHFICSMIKQKFFTAIDALPPAKQPSDTWLLFLPENEFHEIGLLFSNYTIRQAGKKVIYLGANLPLDTLINAVRQISPKHILFFCGHNNSIENSQSYINNLQKNFNDLNIHLAGNEKLISQLIINERVDWICSSDQLMNHLS